MMYKYNSSLEKKGRFAIYKYSNFDGIVKKNNLPTNPYFNNNVSGWPNGASTSLWKVGGYLENTASGTQTYGLIYQTISSVTLASGNVYYYRYKARVTNSVCSFIQLHFDGSSGGTEIYVGKQNTPTINEWYILEGLFTVTDQTGNPFIKISQYYVDAATASGKVMEVDYIEMVSLTSIYDGRTIPSTVEEVKADLFNRGRFMMYKYNSSLEKKGAF